MNHFTFFYMRTGVRMLKPRRAQAVPLFFLRPITEQVPAPMPDLSHGPGFGFVGRATFGDGLIHPVGDLL